MALGLVKRKKMELPESGKGKKIAFLTIFKPVPLTSDCQNIARIEKALESFLSQLDEGCEVLLGFWEGERKLWQPILDKWTLSFSHVWKQVKIVWRTEPDRFPNPKISWQRILSRYAQGEWWLWSDVDIVAPPGFIRRAREEFAQGNGRLLTHAYVIRHFDSVPAMLETLFVNVELFPGIMALTQKKRKDLGFGASLLFHADEVKNSIFWETLGCSLADDFVLGKRLGNSQVGEDILETTAEEKGWGKALLHYLRWQKTIRWCQPVGFAAQVILFPLLGWFLFLGLDHRWGVGLLGILITLLMELIFAKTLCRKVNCIMLWRHSWGIVAWSLIRVMGWLICWLPWPVKWGRKKWWKDKMTHAV
ncbi:MAG: glycosyltransferase [Verrucomicrobiia bacterium]